MAVESSLRKQLLFWLIVGILAFLTIWALRGILLPFLMGLAVAYFLDPVVDLLERMKFSRLWATISITILFGVIVITLLIVLIPLLLTELDKLIDSLPGYIKQLKELIPQWREKWFGNQEFIDEARLNEILTYMTQQIATWSAKTAGSLLSGGLALFNLISLILITPVVAFYLLKDWDRIVNFVDRSLPREHASTIRRLAGEINSVMAGFVRGQVTILIFLGIYYAVGLSLVGLKFGILIGLVAGLISFIPFVGSLVGILVAGAVALTQFPPEWTYVYIVVGVFVSGQIIEGYLLSPKIVGDSVRLHPVWLIFSLFVFGYLLGFIGLLIAVPVAAAIGVLVRFAFELYHESSFYKGQSETKTEQSEA